MSRRIAVLVTNTDTSPASRLFPDDGRKVAAALHALRPGWQVQGWRAMDGELPTAPETLDAVFVTGSPESVNDALPWLPPLFEFIRRTVAARRPLLGLCFGHQAIAAALGGRVGRSPGGWRVGTATTRFDTALPWMDPPARELTLFAVHNEQVLEPPPSAQVLGGDAWCPVGAMGVGDRVFSMQYHPEFSRGFMAEVCNSLDGELPADFMAQARQRIAQPVDADTYFRWAVNFIESAA